MKKYSAFTMIELLVVISIIGLLAALSLVSFTASQKQARDAARKSDLRQYSTSLESFSSQNGSLYPSYTSTPATASTTLCTGLNITTCPEDPKVATDATYPTYKYVSDGSGSGTVDAIKYVLWAKLENSTDYWVVCSNGQVGAKSQSIWSNPTDGTCPI